MPIMLKLGTCFVQPTSTNISHPFYRLVVRVVQLRLKYLEVANLEARGRIWNLGRRINYVTLICRMEYSGIFIVLHDGGGEISRNLWKTDR